jgi:hypothetical protein
LIFLNILKFRQLSADRHYEWRDGRSAPSLEVSDSSKPSLGNSKFARKNCNILCTRNFFHHSIIENTFRFLLSASMQLLLQTIWFSYHNSGALIYRDSISVLGIFMSVHNKQIWKTSNNISSDILESLI